MRSGASCGCVEQGKRFSNEVKEVKKGKVKVKDKEKICEKRFYLSP